MFAATVRWGTSITSHSSLGYATSFSFGASIACGVKLGSQQAKKEYFSVEHLAPRFVAPDRICDYENLAYACTRCNSMKTDVRCVLDPCKHAFGKHLEVLADGA